MFSLSTVNNKSALDLKSGSWALFISYSLSYRHWFLSAAEVSILSKFNAAFSSSFSIITVNNEVCELPRNEHNSKVQLDCCINLRHNLLIWWPVVYIYVYMTFTFTLFSSSFNHLPGWCWSKFFLTTPFHSKPYW